MMMKYTSSKFIISILKINYNMKFIIIILSILQYVYSKDDYYDSVSHVGDSVTLNCNDYPNTSKVDSITWFKYSDPVNKYLSISTINDTKYYENNHKILTTASADLKSSSLTILSSYIGNHGCYGCRFKSGICNRERKTCLGILDSVYLSWTSLMYTTRVRCYIVSLKKDLKTNWMVNGVITEGMSFNDISYDDSYLSGCYMIELKIINSFDKVVSPICRVNFGPKVYEYKINLTNTVPDTLYDKYSNPIRYYNPSNSHITKMK
ncbi:V-type Ig domain protein [Flamingopox virus FGPVKD09]|uniref:V-type Ig domain protein n=1 Tax=Flamingopox virus FGPVKD09 TaxID=2059380 RepID=A0A2H4X2L2_9POXV|nr:V-type Ig domain protein [Flamingopox virus FGPVKD09]AUD40309.1 V-type Ig domain protein [Flamingopox virus FGPVKD09]